VYSLKYAGNPDVDHFGQTCLSVEEAIAAVLLEELPAGLVLDIVEERRPVNLWMLLHHV